MSIFTILLTIHIILGSLSLLLGLFVLVTKKGDKRHQTIGIFYFYSMLGAALISLPMSIMKSHIFLLIIGVFTTYMLLTGKRYLQKKRHNEVKILDWTLTAIMGIFGLCFLFFGGKSLVNGNLFGIVLIVFGLVSSLFVFQDYSNFRGKSSVKNYWLTTHLQRMMGSYISTTTAFLVVNNTLLPSIVAWLLPSAALVPFIIIWSRKYQKSSS